jgi:hypothetical protein
MAKSEVRSLATGPRPDPTIESPIWGLPVARPGHWLGRQALLVDSEALSGH